MVVWALCTVFMLIGITSSTPHPTSDQLFFSEMETGALVCYNMATTSGTQGCGAHSVPPASSFNAVAPTRVDTDQWCQAIASFGGKYATLVAKHVCGFAIWPTRATLASRNWSYGYRVPDGRDIVRDFAESCASVGVRLGIYYSVVSNEYLNVASGQVRDHSTLAPEQVAVTPEEYSQVVIQQLTELWTQYGDLAEIWFDGGFNVSDLDTKLLALLNRTQPHAAVFNGCGLSPNAVAWIGTESGHAPYPVWNTQTGCGSGAGSPDGTSFVPKEVDLTLQNSDTWFFRDGTGYRSLAEMISIYHDSVGHGGNMLLNVAPPPNGTLPAEAMQLYSQLGSFIRGCYGEGSSPSKLALASTSGCTNCSSMTLSVGKQPVLIDRVIIKEELSRGQLVREFEILVDGVVRLNGTAIGRTLIGFLPANTSGSEVELRITQTVEPPSFRLFAVPDPEACASSSNQTSCSLLPDTKYALAGMLKQQHVADVTSCCHACADMAACACFVAMPWNGGYECSLLDSQTGSTRVKGTISGAPKRR